MSNTVIRSLLMLQRIPRYPRTVTVRALNEALENEGLGVSRRTIQRDLEKLSGAFPLISEKAEGSNEYVWSWQPDAAGLELPAMSPNAALAFLVADELGRALLPNQLRRFLDEHRARARQVLAGTTSAPGLQSWAERIAIMPRGQRLLPAEPDERVMMVGGRPRRARAR